MCSYTLNLKKIRYSPGTSFLFVFWKKLSKEKNMWFMSHIMNPFQTLDTQAPPLLFRPQMSFWYFLGEFSRQHGSLSKYLPKQQICLQAILPLSRGENQELPGRLRLLQQRTSRLTDTWCGNSFFILKTVFLLTASFVVQFSL